MEAGKKETSVMDRNHPREYAVFGVDIGKSVFHSVGLDGSAS